MSIINEKFVEYSLCSYTHQRGSGYGWFNRFCRDFLGENFLSSFKEEVLKLRSRDKVKTISQALQKTIYRGEGEWTTEELQDLNQAKDYANELTQGLIHEDWGFKLVSDNDFKGQLNELSGISKTLCLLFFNAGLRMEDFIYESTNFNRVKEGVIEIRSPKKNQSRTLKDENRWGISQEECSEVVELITEILSHSKEPCYVRDRLFEHTKGWKYRPSELRATHGVNLVNQGLSWDEGARIQGVSTAAFKNRCKEYQAAQ